MPARRHYYAAAFAAAMRCASYADIYFRYDAVVDYFRDIIYRHTRRHTLIAAIAAITPLMRCQLYAMLLLDMPRAVADADKPMPPLLLRRPHICVISILFLLTLMLRRCALYATRYALLCYMPRRCAAMLYACAISLIYLPRRHYCCYRLPIFACRHAAMSITFSHIMPRDYAADVADAAAAASAALPRADAAVSLMPRYA